MLRQLYSFDWTTDLTQLFYGGVQSTVGDGGFRIGVSGSGDPFPYPPGLGGRTGTNGLMSIYNTSMNGWVSQIFPDSQETWIIGMAFWVPQLYDGDIIAIANDIDNAQIQWSVGLTSLGGLRVHFYGPLSSSSPIVAVGPNVNYRPSSWNYIECKGSCGNPSTISVRLNGGPIYSATGDARSPASSGNGCVVKLGGVRSIMIDDVYILDGQDASTVSEYGSPTGQSGALKNNDFLGDIKVLPMFPQADGHYTQWTPKSGTTHYSEVNEHNLDYDATYNITIPTTEVPTPIDTFIFSAVDTTGPILGVQLTQVSEKDNAGSRVIQNFCRSAEDTDVPMNKNAVTSTYESFTTQLDNDPVTGSQWTASRLNASEFGVEVFS